MSSGRPDTEIPSPTPVLLARHGRLLSAVPPYHLSSSPKCRLGRKPRERCNGKPEAAAQATRGSVNGRGVERSGPCSGTGPATIRHIRDEQGDRDGLEPGTSGRWRASVARHAQHTMGAAHRRSGSWSQADWQRAPAGLAPLPVRKVVLVMTGRHGDMATPYLPARLIYKGMIRPEASRQCIMYSRPSQGLSPAARTCLLCSGGVLPSQTNGTGSAYCPYRMVGRQHALLRHYRTTGRHVPRSRVHRRTASTIRASDCSWS